MAQQQVIYIVYSNSTSFLGQLAYGIRRMSASSIDTPCAALELTHGGLNDHEKAEWATAKKTIPVQIQQLHHDKIPADIKKYVESNKYEYPCVVGRSVDGRCRMLFADSEISEYSHDPAKFARVLEKRAVQAGLTWK